jgi:hypothetical protein
MPGLAKSDGQGQPHVTQSDDSNPHHPESKQDRNGKRRSHLGTSPPRPMGFASMQRLLIPVQIGLGAAKHLAWYVTHQVSGAPARH